MTLREYMNRICLCGSPRSEHAHAANITGDPVPWIRVIGITSGCRGFVDRIEQQFTGLGAYKLYEENPDQVI